MIQELWLPISSLGGMAIIFGLGLAYASKMFEVKVDERISVVRDVLPGANCGACGQTGCDMFAESLVAGTSSVNDCPVGGSTLAEQLAEILGVKAEKFETKIARVLCGGSNKECRQKFNYLGVMDCAAASGLYGGPTACSYGCLGLGNCVRACPFNAIVINDGLARVIQSKCTACGKCVAACPKEIINIVPQNSNYTVSCSSHDRGNVVRKNCDVGCIGCRRCAKVCPTNAISFEGTLAKIDPKVCTNCGACEKECPTGSIGYYICAQIKGESA